MVGVFQREAVECTKVSSSLRHLLCTVQGVGTGRLEGGREHLGRDQDGRGGQQLHGEYGTLPAPAATFRGEAGDGAASRCGAWSTGWVDRAHDHVELLLL